MCREGADRGATMFAWGDFSTALFAAPTRDLDMTLVVDDSPFTDPSALKPIFSLLP